VKLIKTMQEFREILKRNYSTAVFGFFQENEIISEDEFGYGFPLDSWGQFYASAENLRG
jgi:hypothetical protein